MKNKTKLNTAKAKDVNMKRLTNDELKKAITKKGFDPTDFNIDVNCFFHLKAHMMTEKVDHNKKTMSVADSIFCRKTSKIKNNENFKEFPCISYYFLETYNLKTYTGF